jgi:CRP/FNR family cyclic AMP-dependent transcriptional regulator
MADAAPGIPGLSHLPHGSVGALLRHAGRVSPRKGRVLCYQGDRADRAYLVISGGVRRVLYRSNESTAELGRSGPGEWLGLAEAFLESLYLADAVAETASELLAFSRPGILRVLDSPGIGAYLLGELSRQLYALHGRVEVNLPLDRTVRYLAEQVNAAGEVSATQEEIAAAVGLTRETVNRHLAQLQAEGLIRVGRGGLKILDPSRLASRRADVDR